METPTHLKKKALIKKHKEFPTKFIHSWCLFSAPFSIIAESAAAGAVALTVVDTVATDLPSLFIYSSAVFPFNNYGYCSRAFEFRHRISCAKYTKLLFCWYRKVNVVIAQWVL